jgi:hypothetical protein
LVIDGLGGEDERISRVVFMVAPLLMLKMTTSDALVLVDCR